MLRFVLLIISICLDLIVGLAKADHSLGDAPFAVAMTSGSVREGREGESGSPSSANDVEVWPRGCGQ